MLEELVSEIFTPFAMQKMEVIAALDKIFNAGSEFNIFPDEIFVSGLFPNKRFKYTIKTDYPESSEGVLNLVDFVEQVVKYFYGDTMGKVANAENKFNITMSNLINKVQATVPTLPDVRDYL